MEVPGQGKPAGARRPVSPLQRAELEVRWVQGFLNRKVGFVDSRTICYPSGNYIVFVQIETKERSFLRCKTGNIGAFTVSGNQRVIAFSDRQLYPNIHIYNYPGLRKLAKLKGQASLDYTVLAFSYTGTYLASYSSLPEFSLSIWNWHKKVLLCSQSQPGVEVTSMGFNPMNWHQLVMYNETSVTIWHIERNNEQHILKSKPVKLPAEDGGAQSENNNFFSHPNVFDPYFGPVLPSSAIAGLVGDEAETFRPKDDIQLSVHPTIHCWTPTSDLLMGCEEGYFLKITADTFKAGVLHQKLSSDAKVTRRPTFRSVSRSTALFDVEGTEVQNVVLLSMAYHKDGLYAAGDDGIVRCYKVKGPTFTTEDCLEVEEPLTTLTFSPDYVYLLVETAKGSLFVFNPNDNEDVIQIMSASEGQFIAADFLVPGNQYCVSVAETGEVHVWQVDVGTCISKICLNTMVTTMGCSLSSSSVAVGSKKGHVYFLDLSIVETPRVVHRIFLSESPIRFLHYEQSGQFLIASTPEAYIFVLDAMPTKLFRVLGYVALTNEIVDLSVNYDFDKEVADVVALTCPPDIKRSRVELFSLSSNIISDINCTNERGMLNDVSIQRRTYDLDYILTSVVKRKENILFGYASLAPFILKYQITSRLTWKDQPVTQAEKKMPSKQFGHVVLRLSPHSKWLATFAESGQIYIHDAASLDILTREHCHSYHTRGIRALAFSLDSQFLLATGMQDGTLVCLKWKKIAERKLKDATDFGNYLLNNLNARISRENTRLKNMEEWAIAPTPVYHQSIEASQISIKKTPTIELEEEDEYFKLTQGRPLESTWLDEKVQTATKEEKIKFADKRKELKNRIKELRKKIQDMMFVNGTAPKIEQLEQQEFNLDVEEKEKQQIESEKEVLRVRKDIEMENLANCFLREVIKEECWDSMVVKGRSVKTFHTTCEVQNYPMKARSAEDLKMLEIVHYTKKIEFVDAKLRRQIVEFQSPILEGEKQPEEGEKQEEEEIHALVGSLSSKYGGDTSILYPQLEVHTREEKICQIILLKDIIHHVKMAFNKDFDAVVRMKELEITRVKERNVRIAEILQQLEFKEKIWVPTWSDNEKPEQALIVSENEIKAKQYLTPIQKAKQKIMAKIEYKRRLAAQRENARERGLMDMMGGVLEVKKEDILKMEIPPPPFVGTKPEELWNEADIKMYKEYEKKVKELHEEREKHRKVLETELRKLQASVQETTQGLDEIVNRLFEKKVHTEMVINQEELKITNLLYSLLLDEQLSKREAALHHYLDKKRKEKISFLEAVKTSRTEVDAARETYDILTAEDKLLERGFRKEFSDLPTQHIDQLFKLYKRRPRAPKTKLHVDSGNPYGERPGSTKAQHDAIAHLMKGLDDMDDPENRPEGLDLPSWERFCAARRTKVESEQMVKQKALVLAEMQTFLQKRIEDDEKIRKDIDQIFTELNLLREQKMRYQLDLMVQFLFKQGQVELEGVNLIPDYTDAILINRSIVEDLNSTIRAEGEKKVASMVESKDFRKGIFQLEWEHKKMQMQVEDLNQKAKDIQKINVTKDRQLFLTVLNYDIRMNHEVSIMEATLNFLEKVHKKNLKQREDVIKDLQKHISQKNISNQKLSRELKEMLVVVSERRHIHEATDTEQLQQKILEEHYEDIVQRQQLVDLAKAQAEELSILQAEVERLRMRTFPAFFDVHEF